MRLYNIFIFIFFIGLMLNDWWIVLYIAPWAKQSMFFLPLLIYYIIYPSFPLNKSIQFTFYGYLIILSYQLIVSGGKGLNTAYSYFGNMILIVIMCGLMFDEGKIYLNIKYYLIALLLIVGGFYLGMWDYEQFYGRGGMFSDNPNFTALQLCVGFACSMFMFYYEKSKIKYIYIIYALLMILPVIETASRAGMACIIVTFVCFFYLMYKRYKIALLVFVSISLIFMIQFGAESFLNSYDDDSVGVRLSNVHDDEREYLWGAGIRLAQESIIFGVGLDNFNDDKWRISNGLFLEDKSSGDENVVGDLQAASVHQSFIEMAMIGGIFFMLIYLLVFVYLFYLGARFLFSRNEDAQVKGALIISFVSISFIYAFTAQASINKICWWSLGLCYMFIEAERFKYINWLREKYSKIKTF